MIPFNHTLILYGHSVSGIGDEKGLFNPFVMAFLSSAVFSAIGLYLVIKICHHFKIYDQPNGRKIHHNPIPRLGGIVFMPAAVLGLYVALFALGGLDNRMEISISTIVMAVGALMVYSIGIFDDRFGMKASHKFVIQGISALLLPLCGLIITDLNGLFGIHEISIWVGYPLTVLLIMTIVNAINLIDGIDGLASGLCLLILTAYAYVFAINNFIIIALMNISIVGALIVFFCFNIFGKVGKMKIFMGDAGSLFLGYVCAYMSIKSMMQPIAPVNCGEEQTLISVTLLLIPVIDVVRVTLQRWITGHGIFNPDKTHIHHLFMAAGVSMHGTLIAILLLFTFICGVNYAMWNIRFHIPLILILDIFIYCITLYTLHQMKMSK